MLIPLDVVPSKIDETSLAITIPSPKCLLGMCRIELKNSLSTSVIRNVTKEDVSSIPTEGLEVISFFFPPIDTGVVGVAVVATAIVALVDEVEGTIMYALVQPHDDDDDDELLLLVLLLLCAGVDRVVAANPTEVTHVNNIK